MNKVTCICLGVRDMRKAVRFYRDLGFQSKEERDEPEVIFFETPGTKLELYPLTLLAKDINPTNPPKLTNDFSGITLAYNVEQKQDVEAVVELVIKAGGTIVKEPQDVFWGGYHAYFTDLDGYYWEVAWGANMPLDEQGFLR